MRMVSRRTDIWSWGVCLLELFNGGVSWKFGVEAEQVLTKLTQAGPAFPGPPSMPTAIRDVLERCFCWEPAERWPSFREVIQILTEEYLREFGRDYPRPEPLTPSVTVSGGPRTAPADSSAWLTRARRELGLEASFADDWELPQPTSRRAQIIGEAAVLEEIRHWYLQQVFAGRLHLRHSLLELTRTQAEVHLEASDAPGSLALSQQAAALAEQLCAEGYGANTRELWARALTREAWLLNMFGLYDRALAAQQRVVSIWEHLLTERQSPELRLAAVRGYSALACYHSNLGQHSQALAAHDRSIEEVQLLAEQDRAVDIADDLAAIYVNKAISCCLLGDLTQAIGIYGQAISIREAKLSQGHPQLRPGLALCYENQANCLHVMLDYRRALSAWNRVIDLLSQLAQNEASRKYVPRLADAYKERAMAMLELGDIPAANSSGQQALEILEPLVYEEGRLELTAGLALTYLNLANCRAADGDLPAALGFSERGLELVDRLSQTESGRDVEFIKAFGYGNKAGILSQMGEMAAAIQLHERAIEMLEQLAADGRDVQRVNQLANAYRAKAEILTKRGDLQAGLSAIDAAISIWESLIQRSSGIPRGHWADAVLRRACIRWHMGDIIGATRDAQRACPILREELDRTGRVAWFEILASLPPELTAGQR